MGGGAPQHSHSVYWSRSPQGVWWKKPTQLGPSQRSSQELSEQIRQDQAGRFRLHTVDPEVGTAGVILVSPVRQLEAVSFRVERLPGRNRHGGGVVRLPPRPG